MARHFTPELAREVGKLGGRPKGVLNKSTIIAIKSKEAFAEAIKEKAGFIAENLLISSARGDTSASKELLERAFGKVPQGVQVQSVQFSLKELAEYRKNLTSQQGENPQDALKGLTEGLQEKDDTNINS